MSRTWIKVKRGILEKKHRDAMGSAIWLYLYMLDIVGWMDGTIYNWKDSVHAVDFDMNELTLAKHRRKLADIGYITCLQHHDDQTILIKNYTNPREYSGEVYNQDGAIQMGRSTRKPPSKRVTPTSNTHLKIKQTDLSILREAFCSASGIPSPDWNDFDAGERRALGASWNKPLKLYWKLAGRDVEHAKETIIRAVKGAGFDVHTPRSIQNIFSSYLNRKDSRDGIKRASSTPK